jgi:hypothetical protein
MKTKSQDEYLLHIAFCEKMLQFCDRPSNNKKGKYFRNQIKTAKLAIKKATK